MKKGMARRAFLRTGLAGVVGAGIPALPREATARAVGGLTASKIKEYRMLGRTGFKASDIGFGAADLQEPALLEAAFAAGVNYVDAAEHYANGNAERAVGQVLKKGAFDRKALFITTKIHIARADESKESIKGRALKCLERLQTDWIDCLQIHMVTRLDELRHEGFHAAFRDLKAEGKVRFLGLSCHGAQYGGVPVSMEEILLAAAADGRFDVALFVYNFLQEREGRRILEACAAKGMGATLMKANPVIEYRDLQASFDTMKASGRDIPERAQKMLELYKSRSEESEAFKKKYGLVTFEDVRAAAIRFGLSHPGVHSTCPSITSFEDLEAYVSLSGTTLPPDGEAMLADYGRVHGRFYCRHACGLCQEQCPHEVPVNTILRYNHYFVAQGRERRAMAKYDLLTSAKADRCLSCDGRCEAACPYQVPVQGLLIGAHARLALKA